MIKKITLTSFAALSLLLISAQAEGMKCPSGKCTMKQGSKIMKKQRMSSPFLIKRGLPHMTKMVMKNWDDAQLALTDTQKTKLIEVRKNTMTSLKSIKPKVALLTKEIIVGSKENEDVSKVLFAKVEKLATLKSKATIIQLKCMENTKHILTAKQTAYLLTKKRMMHKLKTN